MSLYLSCLSCCLSDRPVNPDHWNITWYKQTLVLISLQFYYLFELNFSISDSMIQVLFFHPPFCPDVNPQNAANVFSDIQEKKGLVLLLNNVTTFLQKCLQFCVILNTALPWATSACSHYSLNPLQEVGDFSVDAVHVFLGAAFPPAHHPG